MLAPFHSVILIRCSPTLNDDQMIRIKYKILNW